MIRFSIIILLLAACSPSKRLERATNLVLSNPSAIAKVGAVYDALTPKDTTERLVFIEGDTIVTVAHDTLSRIDSVTFEKLNTVYITKTISKTDTIIKTLPPDNRLIARISDSLAKYKALSANMEGNAVATSKQLKTAENRLIWMAGVLLLAGVVIGVLIRLKLKP